MDFLGLSGEDAQRAALAGIFDDPTFRASQDFANENTLKAFAGAGMLNSGGTLKALRDRGAKDASAFVGDRQNRLFGLAGFGQNALGNLTAIDSNIANLRAGIGDARAQGIIGGANAATGFTNNLLELGGKIAASFAGAPGG